MFRENDYDLGIMKDSERFEAVKNERNFRLSLLSIQTGKLMGELSLYDSFRSQVRLRPDDFRFIKHHETPQDIALAPFRFSYLTRPTTYIPMLLFVAMNFPGKQSDKELERDPFTTSDAFYATSLNYQAGVGEEAMFRGWVMPLGMYYTGSGIWANVINSTAFTISHYPINGTGGSAFWFGSGLYFGYVTQRNDWSISEAIFIHTWTNFLATAAEFSYRKKENKNAVLWAPPFSLIW
jgi:membrane protease YdiL (CAAX protease family)